MSYEFGDPRMAKMEEQEKKTKFHSHHPSVEQLLKQGIGLIIWYDICRL